MNIQINKIRSVELTVLGVGKHLFVRVEKLEALEITLTIEGMAITKRMCKKTVSHYEMDVEAFEAAASGELEVF